MKKAAIKKPVKKVETKETIMIPQLIETDEVLPIIDETMSTTVPEEERVEENPVIPTISHMEIPIIERKNHFLKALLISVFAGISLGSLFFYVKPLVTPLVVPPKRTGHAPTPSSVITPTMSAAPDKSSVFIEVQNGAGISGVATIAAKKLQARGYEHVQTGNADKSNYTSISLYISKTMTYDRANFLSDIKKDFPEASEAGELKDSTYSARIIIGK